MKNLIKRFLSVFFVAAITISGATAASAAEKHEMSASELLPLAAKNDGEAQLHLGVKYLKGQGIAQSDAKAKEMFEASAKNGNIHAPNLLVVMYAFEVGVSQDCDKVDEYLQAGKQSQGINFYVEGLLYDYGFCGKRNLARAAGFYERAAEKGLVVAQFSLANILDNRGESTDERGAAKWFLEAAKNYEIRSAKNHAPSVFTLGLFYLDGRGVEQDDDKAYEFLTRAAELGEPFAQFALGEMYFDGSGVRQSYKKAFYWFEKAADQGLPFAYEKLSEMYEEGEGVDQSDRKAEEYANKLKGNYEDLYFGRDEIFDVYYETLPW